MACPWTRTSSSMCGKIKQPSQALSRLVSAASFLRDGTSISRSLIPPRPGMSGRTPGRTSTRYYHLIISLYSVFYSKLIIFTFLRMILSLDSRSRPLKQPWYLVVRLPCGESRLTRQILIHESGREGNAYAFISWLTIPPRYAAAERLWSPASVCVLLPPSTVDPNPIPHR